VGNFAVAEGCFATAIEGDPSDRAAYHHLAVARERKGDLDGAVAACLMGLDAAEDDAYMRKRLFFLLLKKEDLIRALECYETLNGGRMDVDALSGRFLLSCKGLEADGIQWYYRRLQEKLLLAPVDFPQNLQATKERLKELSEGRSLEFFDEAIRFLLARAG
jgi:tetratricopeptide (TPR) repeat protein